MLRRLFRNFLINRWYSGIAVVTLALGLTAVSLTFTLVNTVVLRPLPFAHGERIVAVSQIVPALSSGPTVSTVGEFQQWQKSGLFDYAAALDTAEYTLEGQGRPERIYGVSVTPDFFRIFSMQPLLGRGLSAGDAVPGHDKVIILSHQLWARRFARDPAIIGKTIPVSGEPLVVIGVMPPGFDFPRLADVGTIMNWAPEQSEFWTPFTITPKLVQQGNFNYYVLGRLREGVTRQRAAAQLGAAAVQLFREEEIKQPAYRSLIEELIKTFSVNVSPLRDTMGWGVRNSLWMLLAAVSLLLLLVLFNLGNLLLTQNTHRLHEYTIRQALGGSRWQIFRQNVLEQVLLVGSAVLLSTVLTSWGITAIRTFGANRLPRLYELNFTLEETALLLALASVTAILFGALPQLILPSAGISSSLRSESRTSTSDRRTNRLKSGLMSAQIALSVVLLVSAGLLLQSFANVMRVHPGFDPHHLLTVKVSFDPKRSDTPAKRLQHTRELLDGLRALPGVESATVASRLPLTGDTEIHGMHAVGKPFNKLPEENSAEYRVVDAAYFRTMRIPLIAGRLFRPDDPAQFTVISRKMASRLWPGENPIGKQVTDGDNPPLTVIGVVGDVHNGSLEREEMMQYYRLPIADPYYAGTFIIRSAVDPLNLAPNVQRLVWKLDSTEPVTHAQTMEHILESVTLQRRFETALLTGFAGTALFLSALGLFSIASLSVTRRTREFGIRFALGATAKHVIQLELSRTVAILAIGLATGTVICGLTGRLLTALLFGVSPWDFRIYVSAFLVLVCSALLAIWFPARRAARIDPACALRAE